MELWRELIYKILVEEALERNIQPEVYLKELVELECYKALNEIKSALADSSLDDEDCFMKIERIVSIFESLGIDTDCRHDFG